METVFYAGLRLTPADVGTAVASAISGRVPGNHRGPPPEPAVWLAGLLDAVHGGPLAPAVARALDTAARTGPARALEILGQLLGQRDVLDDPTLSQVLDRPQAWWSDLTARAFAAAVARRVRDGRMAWDPQLRRLALEPRLHGFMLAASVRYDADWLIDQLAEVLARLPDRVATSLALALDDLGGDEAAALRLRLLGRLPDLPDEAARALARALGVHVPEPVPSEVAPDELRPEEAPPDPLAAVPHQADVPSAPPSPAASPAHETTPAPDRPARLDIRGLPWRSDDGRWFLVPDAVQLIPGRLLLRRGWHIRRVDPWIVAPYQISDAEALALRAGQVRSLWALGQALLGGKPPAGDLLAHAASRDQAAKQLRAARRRLRAALEALAEE